jgi:chloramphenicol 3-O-phosphotransferase
MTGLPDLNFPAFNAAAQRLRDFGHEVVNPAEFDQGDEPTWESCMRKDIAQLVECDAVATLEGWKASRGAQLEVHIAAQLGMTVVHADSDLWAAI